MIKIEEKTLCCGCSACSQKCPKQCITMQEDYEGFLYPKIEETLCVNCGLCEKVCHELHPFDEREPLKVLAAINKDEAIRLQSSSGGIFLLLAERAILEGGVVFGAKFDENWQVMLDYAETLEDVKPFMGSKYVQARVGTTYRDAELFLKEGRRVLFSGTPCQVTGLYHYLGKKYDNLTTVDFICHGVPSPKVWHLYLNEIVSLSKQAIGERNFRNSCTEWKQSNFMLWYDKEAMTAELTSYHGTDYYMRAFLADLILRPSCYKCRSKYGRSNSDITIADFWGIHTEIPDMDDDKGTGLIFVNTDKGRSALDWSKIITVESSLEVASKYNSGLLSDIKIHPKRAQFFCSIDDVDSVMQLISRCLRPALKKRIRMQLGKYKLMIKSIMLFSSGEGETECTNRLDCEEFPPTATDFSVVAICFRDKSKGWKSYQIKITMK